MEIGSGALTALVLGLLLGIKHATDADHVVAVSTIVSEYRNPLRGLWIGVSWGIGHTTPLLVAGITILILKEPAAQFYGDYAHFLEFAVGVMLVFLGAQVFWNFSQRNIHVHDHEHQKDPHMHIHTHELSSAPESHHGFLNPGKPFFRVKSYVVGVVHGLAGSATVMLVVLTTDVVSSFMIGVFYIVLFGIGTIISMGFITLLMGIPFSMSGRFERMNGTITILAGTASISFGLYLMYDLVTA